MNLVVSGLQHISKVFVKTDTESLRTWLMKTARSTPSTHSERTYMATNNPHKEMPGSGGHNLLALKEDNWSKKKREEEMKDKEVPSRYTPRPSRSNDDDVPF